MKAPVSINRLPQPDGRWEVTDGDGNSMGKHKTIWSASRQVHEYGPGDAEGGETSGPDEKLHPPVPRPSIPRPPKDTAPHEGPKRIPRP